MSDRLFLYASRGRSVICGGGHAGSGEKGVWHDCGKGGGHAGEGKRGIGMTLGREAVMPKEGKRGYGMTFGREAVMPGEEKQGNGMTLGREAVMPDTIRSTPLAVLSYIREVPLHTDYPLSSRYHRHAFPLHFSSLP